MPEIVAKLRWYPGDELVPIKESDLRGIADRTGAQISVKKPA